MRAALALVIVLCACATSRAPGTPRPVTPEPVEVRSEEATFLAPNFQDADGTKAFVHFTREHMPLRIAVQTPPDAPRDGTPDDARKAVMAGILLWEQENPFYCVPLC